MSEFEKSESLDDDEDLSLLSVAAALEENLCLLFCCRLRLLNLGYNYYCITILFLIFFFIDVGPHTLVAGESRSNSR
jgi:hypothetical protein